MRWLWKHRRAVLCLALAGSFAPPVAADAFFRRGDSNADGVFDLSDGINTLNFLFGAGPSVMTCRDAADSNDSGALDIADASYTFNFLFLGGPAPPAPTFPACGGDPSDDALECTSYAHCEPPPVSSLAEIGHLLNRVTYGPTAEDLARVEEMGIEAYIEEQLDPASIDESGNTALRSREDALFEDLIIHHDTPIVRPGEAWRYFKGTQEPPATWRQQGFNDASWLIGATGIGYGDGDDVTVLSDMRRISDDPATPDVDESQPGYLSVYLRKSFSVPDPAAIRNLVLRVDYDDSFVAYLNGVEVARAGLTGTPPPFNRTGTSHDAGTPQEWDITARRGLLVAGANILAIQVHNTNLTSSDLTMIPELLDREIDPGPARRVIAGARELQSLAHVRGIYSERQLQTVLAEFWENHFTTDLDKVAEYFDALQNSDATDAMSAEQARDEAAQVEYDEYQFYTENALGYFGDLLLYSATSPSMLIYLDNVLNRKGEANENYAREILELSTFGVDNRYNQMDIEQLSKCFTGWSVCKVLPEDRPAFPASSRNPPVECGVQFEEDVFLGLGPGWRYFKGTEEPTPDATGDATTAWAGVGFDDSGWLAGSTGIGYGDGDDATVLSDMRGGYYSVYLRREFTVEDPFEAFNNLILAIDYDDGYVAYLNGVEVGRSANMDDEGNPPDYNDDADENHEHDEGTEYINLNAYLGLLRPAPETNVLAIQVHNVNLDSSDLSCRPRLVDRTILPGSIENGDRGGVWTFRFNSDQHDTTAKVVFQSTPFQINIPAGRTGSLGLRDALDVIDRMTAHPSTAEFICIKLIQKFVSDEITLPTFHDGSAPAELRELLADAIAAWNSTNPKGHIETVMRVILDPEERSGVFWQPIAYRTKVRTPIEYINAAIRLLGGSASGGDLPELNADMGMSLFTRDDPNGWSELGFDWIDTATMLARIEFNQEFAKNGDSDFRWDPAGFLTAYGLSSADDIIDFFDEVMFHGTLPQANKDLLLEFATTDDNGNSLPFSPQRSDYVSRVQELVGLLLSMPQWHFQ